MAKLIRWHVAAVLCGFACTAWADAAQQLCEQIGRQVDSLASMRGTLCIVTAASGAPGRNSFIVLAPADHTNNAGRREALAMIICAAFGYALNANPSVRAEEIWISDAAAIKERQAYVLKAALCRKLQPQVKAGAISLEQMRSQVADALVLRTVRR